MELPYHLKTLPDDALDVIRFLGTLEDATASVDDICDNVGLSDRGFGKVIRRLVTKGYVVMDGSQIYRLSEQGHEAVEELAAYDAAAPLDADDDDQTVERIARRLVLVLPRTVVADEPTRVFVGFDPQPAMDDTADVVARLSVINGEPKTPQEQSFQLSSQAAHYPFWVTPGRHTQTRIRVQVFQLGPNPDDIFVSGGLYVDVNVAASADEGDHNLVAYGANIALERMD
jgi:DNA-binding MarR family transcriptional regulator